MAFIRRYDAFIAFKEWINSVVVCCAYVLLVASCAIQYLWCRFWLQNTYNVKPIAWLCSIVMLVSASVLFYPHFQQLIKPIPQWQYRDNVVAPIDILVLKKAKSYLSGHAHWDQNDDRHCLIVIQKSLFCAVALAQKTITGTYIHLGLPIQEVRFTINDNFKDRWLSHPIMDFNNHELTSFADIILVLDDTIKRLEQRLYSQNIKI